MQDDDGWGDGDEGWGDADEYGADDYLSMDRKDSLMNETDTANTKRYYVLE